MLPQIVNDTSKDLACAVIERALLDSIGFIACESSTSDANEQRIKDDAMNFLLWNGLSYQQISRYWFNAAGVRRFKNKEDVIKAANKVVLSMETLLLEYKKAV